MNLDFELIEKSGFFDPAEKNFLGGSNIQALIVIILLLMVLLLK